MNNTRILFVAIALAWVALPTRADVVIAIEQSGANVELTGSGSLKLTALSLGANGPFTPNGVFSDYADAIVGVSFSSADEYLGASGPSSFAGTGPDESNISGTGDIFGVQGLNGEIFVPHGYAPGGYLSGTATVDNATLSSLGLTPGTYTWTWGTGANADSLTVQIGPAATVVPEPSTAIAAVFGAIAFLAYGRSRQCRAERQAAA